MHQEKSTKQNTHTNTFLSNKMTKNEKKKLLENYIYFHEKLYWKNEKNREKNPKKNKKNMIKLIRKTYILYFTKAIQKEHQT